MKKLIFVASALAALSLLAPGTGQAQGVENAIGIYLNETGDITDQDTAVNFTGTGQFTAYLVLTNPVNNAYAGTSEIRPMDTIYGFECQIIIPAGLFKLSDAFPQQALNVGTEPDWIVGYATPLPVPDNANRGVVLLSMTFLTTDATAYELQLAPSSVPSFPGTMAIADGSITDDNLQQAGPITMTGGDYTTGYDRAVFAVNTDPLITPTDDASWGDVKALFR